MITAVVHLNCWSLCHIMLQVTGLAVSDRHPYMFSAGLDKMVKCWDMEYNKVSVTYQHVHLGICNAAVAPNKPCCILVLLTCIACSPAALFYTSLCFVMSRVPSGFVSGHSSQLSTDFQCAITHS